MSIDTDRDVVRSAQDGAGPPAGHPAIQGLNYSAAQLSKGSTIQRLGFLVDSPVLLAGASSRNKPGSIRVLGVRHCSLGEDALVLVHSTNRPTPAAAPITTGSGSLGCGCWKSDLGCSSTYRRQQRRRIKCPRRRAVWRWTTRAGTRMNTDRQAQYGCRGTVHGDTRYREIAGIGRRPRLG